MPWLSIDRLARAVAAGGAACVAISLWPSDRFPGLALLAYIPTLLLAPAFAWAAFRLRKDPLPAWRIVPVAALGAALALGAYENRRLSAGGGTDSAGDFRILSWNVMGNVVAMDLIVEKNPDVACLNEPGPIRAPAGWHEAGGEGLLILSRHPLSDRRAIRVPGGKALYVRVGAFPPVTLLLVDVDSWPFLHRRPVLEALAEEVARLSPPPDVILGDFNTPSRAASIRAFSGGAWRDAYAECGAGWGATWPSFLPLLRIDQIFLGGWTQGRRLESGFSGESDHRWQVLVLSQAPGAGLKAPEGSCEFRVSSFEPDGPPFNLHPPPPTYHPPQIPELPCHLYALPLCFDACARR